MRFHFGECVVDGDRLILSRDGRPVPLRAKVFDLLLILLRERHRVVRREELVETLWSTTAVGPGSLSGLVNELRAALGESGHGGSSIRTVHARGYQFAAEVVERGGEEEPGHSDWVGVEAGQGERTDRRASDETDLRAHFEHVREDVVRGGVRAVVCVRSEEPERGQWLAQVAEQADQAGFRVRFEGLPEWGDRGCGPRIRALGPIALCLDLGRFERSERWQVDGGLSGLLDRLTGAGVLVLAAASRVPSGPGAPGRSSVDARIADAARIVVDSASRARAASANGLEEPLIDALLDWARTDPAGCASVLRALGRRDSVATGPVRRMRRVESPLRGVTAGEGTDERSAGSSDGGARTKTREAHG